MGGREYGVLLYEYHLHAALKKFPLGKGRQTDLSKEIFPSLALCHFAQRTNPHTAAVKHSQTAHHPGFYFTHISCDSMSLKTPASASGHMREHQLIFGVNEVSDVVMMMMTMITILYR